MNMIVHKPDRSIGIDGEVYYHCDLSFLPEGWARLDYNTSVIPKRNNLHFEDGRISEISKETISLLLQSFEDSKNDLDPDSIENRRLQKEREWKFLDHDGVWKPDYGRKWNEIRQKRNELLKESDFLLWPDYPDLTEEKKAEVTAYRQALRDITDDISDPFEDEVTWPTKPF